MGNYYSPFSLRVSEELISKIKSVARHNKRSANKELEYAIEKYVAEYDVWVTNSGRFMVAPVTIQCLYAPEFRSTVGGLTIEVKE